MFVSAFSLLKASCATISCPPFHWFGAKPQITRWFYTFNMEHFSRIVSEFRLQENVLNKSLQCPFPHLCRDPVPDQLPDPSPDQLPDSFPDQLPDTSPDPFPDISLGPGIYCCPLHTPPLETLLGGRIFHLLSSFHARDSKDLWHYRHKRNF